MRRVTTLVSNLLFAVHVLLGCCIHHAHGGVCDAWNGYTSAGVVGACQRGHHDGHEHPAPNEGNGPGEPCWHECCLYVPAGSMRVDRDDSTVSVALLSPASADSLDAACLAPSRVFLGRGDFHCSQLFLQHCALLL